VLCSVLLEHSVSGSFYTLRLWSMHEWFIKISMEERPWSLPWLMIPRRFLLPVQNRLESLAQGAMVAWLDYQVFQEGSSESGENFSSAVWLDPVSLVTLSLHKPSDLLCMINLHQWIPILLFYTNIVLVPNNFYNDYTNTPFIQKDQSER
jgi:hypothetical protein